MPPDRRIADLLAALDRLGQPTARELATTLGISQPTLSRLVAQAGVEVQRIGRGRATTYVRSRSIAGVGTSAQLHHVDERGRVHALGQLHFLGGQRHWLEAIAPARSELYEGLPPFSADMSPQGYLGRTFSQLHADLQLPRRTSDWSGDHMLAALARRGEDCVGDLILGEESLTRYLAAPVNRATVRDYPRLARGEGDVEPGSSAGGERPKFLCYSGDRHVLVKFTSLANEDGVRWGDLLECEARALDAVRKAGLPAAEARTVDADGMRFLEVVRFDRVGERGRRGVISLGAFDDAYLGDGGGWSKVARRMAERNVLSTDDERNVRWLETFGSLIGNTDMHRGNLSFFCGPAQYDHLRLAPVYDMLPMLYVPREVPLEDPALEPRPPTAANRDVWMSAAKAAMEFWSSVIDAKRVTPKFRRIAEGCSTRLERLIRNMRPMLGDA